jgi:hypothetical protein
MHRGAVHIATHDSFGKPMNIKHKEGSEERRKRRKNATKCNRNRKGSRKAEKRSRKESR